MPRGHHAYSRMTEREADESAQGTVEQSAQLRAAFRVLNLPKPEPYVRPERQGVDWATIGVLEGAQRIVESGPGFQGKGANDE